MHTDVREEVPATRSQLSYQYQVYGVGLRASFPLFLPERSNTDSIEIEIQLRPAGHFSELLQGARLQESPWGNFQYANFDDGASYVRWDGLGEFHVSANGRNIVCRRIEGASPESFQVYLLGQAISFALVKGGFEPLHATCVVIDGKAVALLGDSGYGKSSLAACFLEAGHRLLTDDLLVVREVAGGFQAFPGPPRIKLFSDMARKFLGESVSGVPMNSGAQKLVMPLASERVHFDAAPLEAIYTIAPPHEVAQDQAIRIEGVPSRAAFVLLMNNVFNYVIIDTRRLHTQFGALARLAATTPMRKIFYPRRAEALPLVREAIVTNLLAL
jgi:hypothetical protein